MTIDRSLIPAGSRVLCAVSGGADSMCLLHWMLNQEDLQVCAAHFEHGLRGEESLRDAAFVEAWCAERGVPFLLGRGDAAAAAREKGRGIEETARELRYAFLEQAAERLGCDWILTAHNADDNAETMLLNLCRGAGAAGLCGIPPVRGRILRPLLGCTRAEIEDYLRREEVPHVEDGSNREEIFRRNRIRLQVMPVLRELNPRFSQAALRTADLLREDRDCLEALAEDFLRREFDGESLSLDAFNGLHRAVASRVLRRLCPLSLQQNHVQDALRFCRGEGLGFLDLPGLRLRREQGRLFCGGGEHALLPDRLLREGERLAIPEAGICLQADRTVWQGEVYDLFKTYLFKCEAVCGKLYCTGRRPGDRLHPQGRSCGKSLHDLFREAGMTQRERDARPILRDERGVLAVLGFPADERVRPRPGDTVYRIQISKL